MKKIILPIVLNLYRVYFKLLFTVAPAYATRKAFTLFATPFNKKVRGHDLNTLKTARKEIVLHDGLQIQAYIWGEGEKSALMVHGWEGNGGNFGAFVEPLLNKGFKVVAFDGPAHGKSSGKNTNLFQFSALVANFIRLHKVEVLLTHSFGSAASVYALASQGDLQVEKMVMITTPDKLDDIISDFAAVMKIHPKNKRRITDYMHARFGRKVEEMNVSDMVDACKISELLIIHSKSDKILPFTNAERVASRVPHAVLEAPVDTGHYKILWDEDTVMRVKQFIHTEELVIK